MVKLKLVTCVVICFLLKIHLLTAQEINLNSPAPFDPNVKFGTLTNGMKYYIRSNKLPEQRGEFFIAHNVGAIQEEDNQNGLAHFTEHMAFNGTANFPKKALLDYLATIGVKFGQNVNAGTGVEQTIYNLSSVPLTRDGIIDTCLLILHDWSNYISFAPSELELERGVIREEWRGYGSADERMYIKIAPIIYKDSKYAKRNVIGDTAVINHFTPETIRNFYHRWYRPDLQAIVVIGNFDASVMEEKVKKLFNTIPAVTNPEPKTAYPVPDNVEPLIGIATDPEATSTSVAVIFKHEPVKDEDKNQAFMRLNLEKRLINSMFGQRMSEITRKENAPFLSAYCYYGEYTKTKDAFNGEAQARNNEGIKALTALLTEIERMRLYGFTAGELDRAKANLSRSYESAYTERDKRKNRELIYQNINNFLDKDPNPGIEFEYQFANKIIPGITLDELNTLAKSFVRNDNMVVVVTGPEKEGVIMPTEQEIETVLSSYKSAKIEPYTDNLAGKKLINKEIKPGKVTKVATNVKLGTTEWTLSNGMKIILKPTDFKEDELLLSGYSWGGRSKLKNDEMISAQFVNSVVSEMGVGEFSRTDLTKMLAGKRVSISPFIGGQQEGIRGNMSPKDVELGFQLMYLYFTQPRWNETDYKTFLDKIKNNYINLDAEPRKAFSDSVNFILNNRSLRYRPINYNLLGEVSFEKIKAMYTDRFMDPGDFTLMFTGKIDVDQLKPLVEKYLASLPSPKRKDGFMDDGIRSPKGKVVVDFEKENKTPRTSVMVAFTGNCKYTPEEKVNIAALRHILELRYIETIREEKGGSYHVSVGQNINMLPFPTFMMYMMFDTDPKMADELKAIIHREVNKIVENGPTEVDLQKAKEFFQKQRKDDLKENSWWQGMISEYYSNNVDLVNGYEDLVNKLTVQSLHDYAKALLTQGNVIEVVMRPK
jgi:zinc protease